MFRDFKFPYQCFYSVLQRAQISRCCAMGIYFKVIALCYAEEALEPASWTHFRSQNNGKELLCTCLTLSHYIVSPYCSSKQNSLRGVSKESYKCILATRMFISGVFTKVFKEKKKKEKKLNAQSQGLANK